MLKSLPRGPNNVGTWFPDKGVLDASQYYSHYLILSREYLWIKGGLIKPILFSKKIAN